MESERGVRVWQRRRKTSEEENSQGEEEKGEKAARMVT